MHTEKKTSLTYGHRKNFFELKKVLLIQKTCLWSKEIDFTLKKFFWINYTFFNSKKFFLQPYISKKLFSGCRIWLPSMLFQEKNAFLDIL